MQKSAATDCKPLQPCCGFVHLQSWKTAIATSEYGTVSRRGIQPKRRKQRQENVESPSSAAHHNNVKWQAARLRIKQKAKSTFTASKIKHCPARRMWNPLHLQHTITMSDDMLQDWKSSNKQNLPSPHPKSNTVLQMTCCKIENQAKNHDRMQLPDQNFDHTIQLAKHHKIFALTFWLCQTDTDTLCFQGIQLQWLFLHLAKQPTAKIFLHCI
jgi:hypothetical protein